MKKLRRNLRYGRSLCVVETMGAELGWGPERRAAELEEHERELRAEGL